MAILIAALLTTSPAAALDPQRALTQALLRKWQMPQGLPQPTIFKIIQTADGYLWLGTRSGLFHFDGLRFVAPQQAAELSLNEIWIQDLCEDREHNLWIATNDAGLISLSGTGARRFGREQGLPSDSVRSLLIDRHGVLWAGTDRGLVRFSPRTQTFEAVSLPHGAEAASSGRERATRATVGSAAAAEPQNAGDTPQANAVHALCEAADGSIWVAGDWPGVAIWNGEQFATRRLSSLPARATIRALFGAADGSVWVGTTAGLIQLQGGSERRLSRADGLADDAVECLAQSKDGTLWIGTRDGLSRMQAANIETLRTREGLSQSTVFTLCEDREGCIWAGTKHGLNQFVDRLTIPLTMTEGLPSNDTGPLLQDDSGKVWIGTLGDGLGRSDGRHCGLALGTADGLPGASIYALAKGAEGVVWIGTDSGLCRMRNGRIEESFTTEKGLPSNAVRCLCRDSSGTLWAGTDAGIAGLAGDHFVAPAGDSPTARLPVVALVEFGGAVLAATSGGELYRVVDRCIAPFETQGREPHDVDAFFVDREGALWMGTQGDGLWLFVGDRRFQFTAKDGLYDDEIFGVVADDEDRLWIACSRGIFFVIRSDLLQLAAGKIAKVEARPFSPTDAQRTVECQSGVQPVAWKMHDGRVWFSTIHGVLILDPAHLYRSLPPVPVRIEDAQANGQEMNPKRAPELSTPKLPPGRTNLYFRYTALSLASPTRITFRHRLEGFDRDWIEAGGRREAFYTNLPPGSYRFRVSAANPGGAWSEAEHPIEFTVAPHFYQTAWFWPAAVALLAGSVWGVLRLRVMQVKARWNAVLAERSRIARELHDTLIQGFSGVTMQMQALAARLRESPERKTLGEIIEDAGHALREARRSVGGLRGGGNAAGLAGAIAQAARQLTETRNIRLLLELDEALPALGADVEYNVLRIAQEAITNALKHSGARTVEVQMECVGGELQLSVRDDGRGCAISELEHPGPGHYGLIGMRERASQIRGELRLDSAPGRGTTVSLKLPLVESRE